MKPIPSNSFGGRGIGRRDFLQLLAMAGSVVLLPARLVEGAEAIVGDRRTVQAAMQFAGECCLAWLDPAHDYFPWGGYEVAHDTGRWWNAMPRLEAATGFVIPPELEAPMLRNLWRLTRNPDALLLNDPEIEALAGLKNGINLHNLREGLLAFAVLHHFRGNEWARHRGHDLIETIATCLLPNGGIDVNGLKSMGRIALRADPLQSQPADPHAWFDCSGSTGRALEAVVYFYQVTGDPAALELAARLAGVVAANLLSEDGSVRKEILAPDHVGHNHSYQGTLRGLLVYALQTGQSGLVERVYATYRRGVLGSLVFESGWSRHDLGRIRFPNRDGDPVSETGSCADAVQLGLWLALKAGHVELLDDVERLLRSRILPEQIVESKDPRKRGGWGVHADPYGRFSTFDVFAAVLVTLIEIYEHAVVKKDGTLWVNLNLSMKTPLAEIEDARSASGARVRIRTKWTGDLRVRVPGWAPRESVRLASEGKPLPLHFDGHYLVIAPGDRATTVAIDLSYELPTRETVERMPVSGKLYRLTWRGDEVIHCDPPVEIWPSVTV